MPLSFSAFVAEKLGPEKFAVLDIGCSGGIDPRWRAFEPRLRALGIDASEVECRRLAGLERNPDVSYVAAFVSSSANKPVDHSAGWASPLIMKVRDRMSFMRTREIREGRLKDASTEEKLRHNAWELTGLADPGKPIDLSAGPAAPLIMKIRDRMSFMRTREIREERLKDASAEEQFRHNAWE
ncbi:MAG: hypothetical protein QOG78_3297, partial [Rhodospirillaceae bacterium]|nr:hypothetical protein [Rhodospirillaceae bacterium]